VSLPAGKARFALHGGAGVIDRKRFTAEREQAYRDQLGAIAGRARLALLAGASALDVVEQAVSELEDCPWFNAGHGAVLTSDATVELDAAIMDGRDRSCGAVAAIRRIAHPVAVARALLRDGTHVLLAGDGALRFAVATGFEAIDEASLIIPERREQLRLAQTSGRVSLDHDEHYAGFDPADRSGTVGAVARDLNGHLAAATSTGGMTNQHAGRVGDSPLIGCGTWADNSTACISATGHGEYFIRAQVGHDIHARMAYVGASLAEAAQAVLDRVRQMGGSGGLIAIDRAGHIALPFTSPGMYRAWMAADGEVRVAIWAEEQGWVKEQG
jgi:isoaspartyl peptidase/L-asparaginase-like protein (Ntn-hydrolase superfamily)